MENFSPHTPLWGILKASSLSDSIGQDKGKAQHVLSPYADREPSNFACSCGQGSALLRRSDELASLALDRASSVALPKVSAPGGYQHAPVSPGGCSPLTLCRSVRTCPNRRRSRHRQAYTTPPDETLPDDDPREGLYDDHVHHALADGIRRHGVTFGRPARVSRTHHGAAKCLPLTCPPLLPLR